MRVKSLFGDTHLIDALGLSGYGFGEVIYSELPTFYASLSWQY